MGPEVLVPVSSFVCTAAVIFGLRYMSNKEKMAMIERGMDPRIKKSEVSAIKKSEVSAPKPFLSLKFGLLMVGLGIGLLIALFTVRAIGVDEDEGAAVYFGCLSVFGGLGLIISYLVEKSWLDSQKS